MDELKYGSKGKAVKEIQKQLKELGLYMGKIDGDYGPLTRAAVKGFQSRYMVTGKVDDLTTAALKYEYETERDFVAEVKVPRSLAEVERIFGKIEYEDLDGGNIKITNGWARQNIRRVELPIVGKKWIHKKLEQVFRWILQEIEAVGLADEVVQFGTWAPRHKMHNPRRPLSMHSWGIACDVNWRTNAWGTEGDLDPEIVAIFEKHGFLWGGRWRRPDPMHFEFTKGF